MSLQAFLAGGVSPFSIALGLGGVAAGAGGVFAPTITGLAQAGQTLTASQASTWSVGGVAKSFFAASTSYLIVPGDVGKTITATSSNGTSAPTATVAEAPLAAASPTIAYGAKVAMLGDSITQQNIVAQAVTGDTGFGAAQRQGWGELSALVDLDPRYNVDNVYDVTKTTTGTNRFTNGSDQGINGQTSTQIAARVSDVIALAPAVCVLNMGTNNAQQRTIVLSDITSTVTALRGASPPIAAVVGTIRPNTIANESTSRSKADIQAINATIRSYVAGLGDSGVVLWDAYAQLDRGDGYMDASDAYDLLLHPNSRGAELSAWGLDPTNPSPFSLAAALRKLVQPGDRIADFMAANTNFNYNWNFAVATGGTIDSFGGVTGTVPNGWRFGRKNGSVLSTAVIGTEANAATSGNTVTIVLTAQGTATYEEFDFYKFAATQVGLGSSWVRGAMEVDTDGAPWISIPVLSLAMLDGATTTVIPRAPNSNAPQRGVARRRKIMTDAALTRSGNTSYGPSIAIATNPSLVAPGTTATIKIRFVHASTSPSPRPTWNIAPTLGAITISPSTATIGTAYSGTVTGRTPGSVISLTGAGAAGLTFASGTNLITGTPTTAGAVNVVETLGDATNTPRTSSAVVTVS